MKQGSPTLVEVEHVKPGRTETRDVSSTRAEPVTKIRCLFCNSSKLFDSVEEWLFHLKYEDGYEG